MKKRKIIIVSCILGLLLFTPILSAAKTKNIYDKKNTIFETTKQKIQTKTLDTIKHPLLRMLVVLKAGFRLSRFWVLELISSELVWKGEDHVLRPLIYLRAQILYFFTDLYLTFWYTQAEKNNWNW